MATEQSHVMQRHPTVLPLVRALVERAEVLGDRERCAGLPIVAVLNLGVSGETALKSGLCHVLRVRLGVALLGGERLDSGRLTLAARDLDGARDGLIDVGCRPDLDSACGLTGPQHVGVAVEADAATGVVGAAWPPDGDERLPHPLRRLPRPAGRFHEVDVHGLFPAYHVHSGDREYLRA